MVSKHLKCIVNSLSLSSRHIRQQGGRHPGSVRRRLHRERHRLQRGQRVPGHRRGVDPGRRGVALQGQGVQGGPREPGLLRHALHHHGRHLHAHPAVPAAGLGGRGGAGGAADLQDYHVAAVLLHVADLHPAGFTGGLLPSTSVLNGEETDPLPRGGEGGREESSEGPGQMGSRGGSIMDSQFPLFLRFSVFQIYFCLSIYLFPANTKSFLH